VTLADGAKLKHAYEQTAAIAREFADDRPGEVELPLAEMFGIDHGALLDFLTEFVDDIVHGTMQAMYEGKLPRETSVLGRQMMAVMVRGMAMGVVLERERHEELLRLVKEAVAEDVFTEWHSDSHRCNSCGEANLSRTEDHPETCLYRRMVERVGVRA
jgi:hypothetical protein